MRATAVSILRAKFPSAFYLLDEHEAKSFDPRATIQGLGPRQDRFHDPETGITIYWDR